MPSRRPYRGQNGKRPRIESKPDRSKSSGQTVAGTNVFEAFTFYPFELQPPTFINTCCLATVVEGVDICGCGANHVGYFDLDARHDQYSLVSIHMDKENHHFDWDNTKILG
eukprot:g43461.t1